jgi:hypothetical protein
MVTDAALMDLTRVLAAGGVHDAETLAIECAVDDDELRDLLAVAGEHGLVRRIPGREPAWCATFRARRLAAVI